MGDRVYPSGGYLQQRYGLSDEEAARRHIVMDAAVAFNTSLYENPPQGYSDLWIRHEPTFAIVLNVRPPYDRAAFLARAPEVLRGDLEFFEVTRTRTEIERDQDRIIASWRGFRNWSGGYEVQTDRFRFTTASDAEHAAMRAALPADLREQVVLAVGPQPVPLSR
ncbi:hypothetical protein [Aurantiacibacter luteus]|uniref:Uncharacterized protein n=1 Tax=Aurantiacibacter luteus TaxID=1581420 RepID=A0A0G9N2R8_9SPHN|nr:hypothetical protein [Aurantiacibacter luteus]KLE35828.1 hypothetical protein AAW00_05520 [Aurantiacibacter luteus]